jgi:hypothetical protein
MVSLVRQHDLSETAQASNEKLHAEITARKRAKEELVGSEKLASVGRMGAVLAQRPTILSKRLQISYTSLRCRTKAYRPHHAPDTWLLSGDRSSGGDSRCGIAGGGIRT